MKLKLIFMTILAIFALAGCTIEPNNNGEDPNKDPNDSPKTTTELRNEKTLAYSTYLAASFLEDASADTNDSISHTGPLFLQKKDSVLLEIDKELGEVSQYFRRLKVFLDHGLDNPFTIETGFDVNTQYDIEMRYTVEAVTYTILFNEDENGVLDGVMIMNGHEYALEGTREVERDIDDGVEESEEEIFLRTTDPDTDNFVEIEIETEQDADEFEFEMTMTMVIDGIEKELYIEFESDEDEVTIAIETPDGNAYEFTREDDDGVIEYEFEYTVNGIDGEVVLTITTVEGKEIYHYVIEEDGKEKIFSEPIDEDDEDMDDDDEDEDDSV